MSKLLLRTALAFKTMATPQIRHSLSLPALILGSVVLAGLVSDLTPIGSTRSELVILFLFWLTGLVLLRTPSLRAKELQSDGGTPHPRIWWPFHLGALFVFSSGALIAVIETVRGGTSGSFASIYAEDNAAWLRIIVNWFHETELRSSFGDSLALLLAVLTTLSVTLSFGQLGVDTLGDLALQINIIYLVVHIAAGLQILFAIQRFVRFRGRVGLANLGAIVALTFQQLWIFDGRMAGHLSAIIASQVILYFLLCMTLSCSHQDLSLPLVLLFLAGACTLWLPLKGAIPFLIVSSAFFATKLFSSRFVAQGRGLRFLYTLIGILCLLFVARSLAGRLRSFLGDAVSLVQAPGGTNSPSEFEFVFLAAVATLAILSTRSTLSRAVVLAFLSLGLATRTFSELVVGEPTYASLKMGWWIYGTLLPFSIIILTLNVGESRWFLDRQREGFVRKVALLAFATFAVASTPFALVQRVGAAPVHEWLREKEYFEDGTWWGVSDEVLNASVKNGPIGCASVDAEFMMIPNWDGYLCTRFTAWATVWDRATVDPESPLRALGLGALTQPAVVGAVIETSDVNLGRDIVLLDDGELIGSARLLDALRLQNPATLRVVWASSVNQASSSALLGHVDEVNGVSGTISGWVEPDVTTLTVVGEGQTTPIVERVFRKDVVDLFGWSFALSGLEVFIAPHEIGKITCLAVSSDMGPKQVIWMRDGRNC